MCRHTNLYGCWWTHHLSQPTLQDSSVCAPARKSMCVTNPTMNLLYPSCPSCLFHSNLTDEEVARLQPWLSWPYLYRRSLSLWCLSVNWLAFSGFDPDVWCKTQTPTHQRELGEGGRMDFYFGRNIDFRHWSDEASSFSYPMWNYWI